MKKIVGFLLLALLIASLVACARTETIYERTVNGETYVINRENDTVTHDGNVYKYMLFGVGTNVSSSWSLTITYPDGSWYRKDVDSNGYVELGSEQTSDDYDPKKYAKGEDLCYVLEELTLKAASGGGNGLTQEKMIAKVLASLVLISVGVLNLVFPGLFHSLKYRLWVRDAEPTEFAVGMARIAGVIYIVMGISVLLFVR